MLDPGDSTGEAVTRRDAIAKGELLGPTDPVENAPYPAAPSRTVRVAIGCNPCRRGCAAATCMRMIAPSAVLEAARALLATSATRPVDCAAPAAPARGEERPE